MVNKGRSNKERMHVPGTKVLARIKIVLNPHINDPYARALNPSIF